MAGARPLPLGAQLEFLGSVEVVVVAVVDVVLRVLFGTGFAAAWCDGLEPHALKPTAMPTADTQRAVSTDGRIGSLVSDLERRDGCPSLSLHNVVSKPKPPSCIAIAHFACSEDPPTPPETDETLGDARSGSPAPPWRRALGRIRSSEAYESRSGLSVREPDLTSRMGLRFCGVGTPPLCNRTCRAEHSQFPWPAITQSRAGCPGYGAPDLVMGRQIDKDHMPTLGGCRLLFNLRPNDAGEGRRPTGRIH